MIKLINEELIDITTEEKVNKMNETYTEVLFKTAVETKNAKTGEIKKHVITKLFAESEDYNSANTGINVSATEYGTRVGLRSSNQKVKNDTTIYIAAIPFNGYIEPIERTFDYRIYKSMVVVSEKRDIEFRGLMYKKVAYLIIVPNEKMFDESHKYHKDVLEFVMNSYNLESIGENERETVRTISTLQFTAAGDNEVYSAINETVDPINPEDFKGQPTFALYRPMNKKSDNNAAPKATKIKSAKVDNTEATDNTDHSLDDMIAALNKQYSIEGTSDRNRKSRKKGKGKNRR